MVQQLVNISALFLFSISLGHAAFQALRLSDNEIAGAINEMRKADVNRAANNQVDVDFQSHTSSRNNDDNADNVMFPYVDNALLNQPTYKALRSLFDNYVREVGYAEEVTQEEEAENQNFIDVICDTEVMKILRRTMSDAGHPWASDFKTALYDLWFDSYSRARGKQDTSSFEHVFIGEVKNGKVSGLHNWVRIYELEQDKSENFNYHGYVIKRPNLAMGKFKWQGEMKPSGSFLLGTSPEFEVALYTLCFLARDGRNCNFELDGCPMSVKSYKNTQRSKTLIGTVYPVAGPNCRPPLHRDLH